MILRKPEPKKREPQPGDYRVDILFAWWPTKTDDGVIWLEKYKRVYEWSIRRRSWFIGRNYLGPIECGDWDIRHVKRLKINKTSIQ
jgi:hypothetical protein